jgi:DNA (cytosine-5)-methyltransferase 1
VGTPTILSICSGYGGIELGLSAVEDFKPVCYVENDLSQASILAARMEEGLLPEAPIWSDLTTFDCTPWSGKVDIITGGFPCQPWSVAGKQLGEKDPRHLWPHVARVASELGYPTLFLENVPGILDSYYFSIRPELQSMGYRVKEGLYTAEETGAPHRRQRLFFMAVHGNNTSALALPNAERLQGFAWNYGVSERAVHPHIEHDRDAVRSWSGWGSNEMENSGSQRCQRRDRGLGQRTLQGSGGTTYQAESSGSKLEELPNPKLDGPSATTVRGGDNKTLHRTQEGKDNTVQPERVHTTRDASQELGDSNSEGLQGRGECRYSAREWSPREAGTKLIPLYPPGPEDEKGWAYMLSEMPQAQPSICFTVDGRPSQLERQLRSYGNGVVPAMAAIAWCDLAQAFIQEDYMV